MVEGEGIETVNIANRRSRMRTSLSVFVSHSGYDDDADFYQDPNHPEESGTSIAQQEHADMYGDTM
eukprot:581338-Hanusia_phi.AAC.13